MNFDLTEDEIMLRGVAERFVLDRYDTESRRQYLAQAGGFCTENWAILAELGILAGAIAAEHGGLELGLTGITVLAEALGHGMVVEPVCESAFFTAPLFLTSASPALQDQWAAPLVTGEKRVAFAHFEKGSRGGSTWIETRASRNGSGIIINGCKPYVAAGAGADGYIVSARMEGSPGDCHGWSLYFVPADTPGLTSSGWRMADGCYAARLTFDNVSIDPDFALGDGRAALEAAMPRASLVSSAEALGIMERLFAETLDYVRQRQQFGSPIGKFQAVQHRLAQQYSQIQQGRALLELAIVSEGGESFGTAVDGARAFIAQAAIELGHEAIQLHGGMGITDELAIGHGHKRLLVISRWPDDAVTALDRYANAV